MHWQYGVASCHYANRNIYYLGGQFGDRLFAKGSRVGKNWPAHSPDLSVMDFCIWNQFLQCPMQTTNPELVDKAKCLMYCHLKTFH